MKEGIPSCTAVNYWKGWRKIAKPGKSDGYHGADAEKPRNENNVAFAGRQQESTILLSDILSYNQDSGLITVKFYPWIITVSE